MQYWVMKSEPDTFSIADLKRAGKSEWEGVRNYQARNFMRDMQVGDAVLMYHSNAGAETGVVGEMAVATLAHPDSAQFKPDSQYYDPKSPEDNPRWWCVDVQYKSTFPRVVTLEVLKQDKVFSDSRLTQKGNRLSIVPLTKRQYERVLALSRKSV